MLARRIILVRERSIPPTFATVAGVGTAVRFLTGAVRTKTTAGPCGPAED